MKAKNKTLEERVYRTAEEFLTKYGIKGWNMNDLAAESGITKRTLYKIIESKESLIRNIVFKNIMDMREQLLFIIRSDKNFLQSLEQIVYKIPELLKSTFISKYGEILHEYPDIELEFVRETEIFFNELRDYFQNGINSGFLKKELTPDFIYHSFQAIALYFIKYSKTQSEAADRIGLALKLIFQGSINREDEPVKRKK